MVLSSGDEKILNSIVVPSENNPNKPEFPPHNPKFPATPTYEIEVPGFSNVWLKDDSINSTGTHKDRMAWELVVTYRDILITKKTGQVKGHLPQMSIISFGSAAIAIQSLFIKYRLPTLKVLIDPNFVGSEATRAMKHLGCEIYETDLAQKPLNSEEILLLTENMSGIDITSNEALGPTTRFYDWMSYEIVNNNPNYVFIPFGTGNLYENVLNVTKKEVLTKNHDPRLRGKIKTIRTCNFLGATTNNPKGRADKLYSPHLPFVHFNDNWIRFYKYVGACGQKSNIHLITEGSLNKAMEIADSERVQCEPSGIAGLALMLQMKNKLPRNKKMLIVNTGGTEFPSEIS